jgi:hypothetical protein
MSNNKDKELEEEELEETPVSENNHNKGEGCLKVSGTSFVICIGMPYAFTIGRKTVIGIVEEVNKRFLRVVVSTESGKVVLDLRKVSMISEVK